MDTTKVQCDPSITKSGERKPFVSPSLKRFETPRLTPMGSIESVVLGHTNTGDDFGSS
jgi:hypothetical protein